ncbi:unnamed protein product [Agarophyton chilense]
MARIYGTFGSDSAGTYSIELILSPQQALASEQNTIKKKTATSDPPNSSQPSSTSSLLSHPQPALRVQQSSLASNLPTPYFKMMIKTLVAIAIFSAANGVSVPSIFRIMSHTPTPAPTSAPTPTPAPAPVPMMTDDIMVSLADGTAGAASGDNAVVAGANKDSGAVGAKGEDVAFGAAGPGAAVGFGAEFPQPATASPSDFGSLFNIFN